MRIVLVLVCLVAATAAHAEKKVYKCTNADGSSVFSPSPCGTAAQEMQVPVSAPDSPVPASSEPPLKPASQEPPSAAPALAPDAEDARCRQDAGLLRSTPADANLVTLLQRQGDLVRNYAANPTEGGKIQIGNLDGAIAAEQKRLAEVQERAERAYASAIAKCDARNATRDRGSGRP